MFKLSKKADYGLIAVKHLAIHRVQHACSASEIAEEYGISATLMAKGFLVVAKGPPLIHRDIIVKVPDHVWDVLVEHSAEFTYGAPADGKETQPWRIPWMAR